MHKRQKLRQECRQGKEIIAIAIIIFISQR